MTRRQSDKPSSTHEDESEWGAASKAVAERIEYGLGLHDGYVASPVRRLQDRTVTQQTLGTAANCWLQAGPLPVLTSLDPIRRKWISLRVKRHRQIMVVGLYWKCLEPPLSGMAVADVVSVIPPNAAGQEPFRPATLVKILLRPRKTMEMDCHPTQPCRRHRHFHVSFPHQIHKRGEVVILVENVAVAIGPLQDMVNHNTKPRARLSMCVAWKQTATPYFARKVECPLIAFIAYTCVSPVSRHTYKWALLKTGQSGIHVPRFPKLSPHEA